jgi:hypothetical protein
MYASQWQCGQVIPPDAGFPFRHLLRLVGLLWPAHRAKGSALSDSCGSYGKQTGHIATGDLCPRLFVRDQRHPSTGKAGPGCEIGPAVLMSCFPFDVPLLGEIWMKVVVSPTGPRREGGARPATLQAFPKVKSYCRYTTFTCSCPPPPNFLQIYGLWETFTVCSCLPMSSHIACKVMP